MTCQGPMSGLDATPPGEDKAGIGSWRATYILSILLLIVFVIIIIIIMNPIECQ